MPNMPVFNVALPERVYERLWDWLIGSLADAADHYQRPQLADQIAKLRITPDLPRIINDVVLRGWRDWLADGAFEPIKAAVVQELADHMPTLLRQNFNGTFRSPMGETELVREVAAWLYRTPRGFTYGECVRAGHQLFKFVQNAAVVEPALQGVMGLIFAWQNANPRSEPAASKRLEHAQHEARVCAARLHAPVVTTAHLLYGISHLRPAGVSQHTLAKHGALPDNIIVALEALGKEEAAAAPTDPLDTVGVELAVADARTLAWLNGQSDYTDEHLFRALLLIAADSKCVVGAAVRNLFKLLKLNPHTLLHALNGGVMTSGQDLPGGLPAPQDE